MSLRPVLTTLSLIVSSWTKLFAEISCFVYYQKCLTPNFAPFVNLFNITGQYSTCNRWFCFSKKQAAIVKQVNENLVDLFSMVQNVIQCDLSDLLLSQRLHSLIFKYWPFYQTQLVLWTVSQSPM